MAKGRFHLTFPGHLVHEPVIHDLGKRFGVVTTIRRANLEEGSGWVIIDIDGADDALRDALAWLAGRGVHVDRIEAEG